MLVWLAELLTPHFTFFNVFSYLTFRAILSIITGLVVELWMGPRLIRRLQIMKFGQVIRNDGPESHLSKKGTPTMGGLMIIAAIFTSVLLWCRLDNPYVWLVLFVLGPMAPSVLPMTISRWCARTPMASSPAGSTSGSPRSRWVWQSSSTPRPPTMVRPSWWSPSSRM